MDTIKKEFKEIKKTIDVLRTESMQIEENIKAYWYRLIDSGDENLWNQLIDICHYLRFIAIHPEIQVNIVQYSHWKNIVHMWDKSH